MDKSKSSSLKINYIQGGNDVFCTSINSQSHIFESSPILLPRIKSAKPYFLPKINTNSCSPKRQQSSTADTFENQAFSQVLIVDDDASNILSLDYHTEANDSSQNIKECMSVGMT